MSNVMKVTTGPGCAPISIAYSVLKCSNIMYNIPSLLGHELSTQIYMFPNKTHENSSQLMDIFFVPDIKPDEPQIHYQL